MLQNKQKNILTILSQTLAEFKGKSERSVFATLLQWIFDFYIGAV